MIDKAHGWQPELDGALHPVSRVFEGRPDIYHAVQACLIPLFPADGSLTRQLKRSGLQAVEGFCASDAELEKR